MQFNSTVVRFQFPDIAPVEKPIEPEPPVIDQQALVRRFMRRAREHGYREGLEQGKGDGFSTGHAEGVRQGMEDGHRQGYEQGLENGRTESQGKVDQIHNLLMACWQELSEWRDVCARELDEQLVSVISLICRKVIRLELEVRPDRVRELLDHALGLLPQTDTATIRLNPEDRVYLETLSLTLPERWRIVDDETIDAGGCVLSTPGGRVDARVETRTKACIAGLRKSLGLPDNNGNGNGCSK